LGNDTSFQGSGGGAIAYAQQIKNDPTAFSTHTVNNTVFQNNTSVGSPSDDIFNYDGVFNNNKNTIECGNGYGNCFCDADSNFLPDITTNYLPTTCFGSTGVCSGCIPPAVPAVCPTSITTRGSTMQANAPMDIMDMLDMLEKKLEEKEEENEHEGKKKKGW
jgi:hypothetical protein